MPKRAYHHGNLRPALLKAALRAIAEEGPDKFTLRDVARRAGVSAPAVYRHFEDKDDLLAAVAADCSDRLAAAMIDGVASAPPDPLERFRATGIALVRFAVAHPEHFRAMNLPGLAERTPAVQRDKEAAWLAEQRRALAAAQDDGGLAQLPIDDILLAANALMVGLAHMIVEGKLGAVDDARAVELATIATRAIGVGFVPRSEPVQDPRDRVEVAPRPGRKPSPWRRARPAGP
jgi:AcrR family transcriptional regulator